MTTKERQAEIQQQIAIAEETFQVALQRLRQELVIGNPGHIRVQINHDGRFLTQEQCVTDSRKEIKQKKVKKIGG